jgi:hypothetical protein
MVCGGGGEGNTVIQSLASFFDFGAGEGSGNPGFASDVVVEVFYRGLDARNYLDAT